VGWAGDLSYFIFSVINFLTLVNYIIVWIALKWHASKNQNQGVVDDLGYSPRAAK